MINSYQQQYYNITKRIIEQPHKVGETRIGTANSRFCEVLRINLTKEFPIMDIKWIKFSNVVHELLWMVRGETNIKYLIENDCHIWTDDAYRYYKEKYSHVTKRNTRVNGFTKQIPINFDDEITKEEFVEKVLNVEHLPSRNGLSYVFGDMDNIYGYQWRSFNGETDQLQNVIDTLKTNPDDRRMIIIGHNPDDLEREIVGLPACHNYMQFYTTTNKEGKRVLNTFCNIRSNDWFLGQPYNVVQYALLTHMIAQVVEMEVGELVINAVDAHLYHEHFEPAKIWLERFEKIGSKTFVIDIGNKSEIEIEKQIAELVRKYKKRTEPINEDLFIPVRENENVNVLDGTYCKAKLTVNNEIRNIDDFKFEDFKLTNYNPQPYIKAKLLT